jgi:hypothetical protein
MPIELTVVDKRFYPVSLNQSSLGLHTSKELNINAMENCITDITVSLGWFSDLQDARLISADNGLGILAPRADNGIIIKNGHDFVADGHSVGDRCDLLVSVQRFGGGVPSSGVVATARVIVDITAISQGRLEFRAVNYSTPATNPLIYNIEQDSIKLSVDGCKDYTFGSDGVGIVNARLKGRATDAKNIRFSPALIPNQDSEIVNILTGDKPVYVANDVNPSLQSMSFASNNKASDFLFRKEVRRGNLRVDAWKANQWFTDTQSLIKTYREYVFRIGFINYLNHIEGESAFERFYKGTNSIKFAFSAEFRTNANDPKTAKIAEFTQDNGNVGFLNENFSGGVNNYRVENVIYSNNLGYNGINLSEDTDLTFRVRSLNTPFNNGRGFGIAFTCFPTSDIYEFSDKYTQREVLSLNNNNGEIGSVRIYAGSFHRRIESTIISSHVIEVKVRYVFNQSDNGRAVLDLYDQGDEYMIGIVIDNGGSPETTDRVTLLVDRNRFEKNTNIEGLIDLIKAEYQPIDYNQTFTGLQAFNEDIVKCKFEFCSNLELDAVIDDIEFQFLATSRGVIDFEFMIQRFPLPWNDITNLGKRQIINTEQPRGLLIPEGDFNIISIKSTNFDSVNQKQYYEVEVSFRINWQEWLRLDSLFEQAPPLYFDENKPFNGYNQLTSNYSSLQNIRGCLLLNVRQGDNSTPYRLEGGRIQVRDYETPYPQGSTTWGAIDIETFDEEDNNLGGIILQGVTTKFVITHNTLVDLSGLPTSDFGFAVRIEEAEQSGFALAEYNSLLGTYNGSPFSNVSMHIFNSRIEIRGEVLFDLQANISSRIYLKNTTDTEITIGQFDDSFDDSFFV